MRIFIDTNVLASALATRGLCTEVLEGVIAHHELLTCEAVLQELQRVLAGKFRLPKAAVRGYLDLLRSEGLIIRESTTIRLKLKDPDDVPILSCAVAAKADVFVTGDKALLELEKVEDVPLLSPRQLYQKLTGLG